MVFGAKIRFTPTPELYAACENRHIPRDLLLLLSRLVHVNPEHRPTADKVKATLKNLVCLTCSSGCIC